MSPPSWWNRMPPFISPLPLAPCLGMQSAVSGWLAPPRHSSCLVAFYVLSSLQVPSSSAPKMTVTSGGGGGGVAVVKRTSPRRRLVSASAALCYRSPVVEQKLTTRTSPPSSASTKTYSAVRKVPGPTKRTLVLVKVGRGKVWSGWGWARLSLCRLSK